MNEKIHSLVADSNFQSFNLNKYLRSFIRSDLTYQYEVKCLEIVEKYKGMITTDEVIRDMMAEFNEALSNLSDLIIYTRK
jgi:hypothetical protein